MSGRVRRDTPAGGRAGGVSGALGMVAVRAARLDRAQIPAYAVPLLLVAMTMLSWTAVDPVASASLDQSWRAGLWMGTHDGLSYGHDLLFTYGPLGFLDSAVAGLTVWYSAMTLWALAYLILFRLLTVAAIFYGARQSFGNVVSFVLAVIGASLAPTLAETAPLMVLAAWMLRTRLASRTAIALAVLLGAFSAIELLDKLSTGTAFLLMAGVTLLALPVARWRAIGAGVVSAIVVFLALWLATGGALSAIPSYIRGSIQISSGYGPAMSFETPGYGWLYSVVLVVLVGGLWAAWDSTRGRVGRPQQAALGLVWLIFWFFAFKEAMVREDSAHVFEVVEPLLVGWCGFRWSRDSRLRLFAGFAVLAIAILAIDQASLTDIVSPKRSVIAAVDNVRSLVNSSDRSQLEAQGRAAVKAAENVDPASLQAVAEHTVAVYPAETDVAWAYDLHWDPMPVFQSYVAYTPYLDSLNARFLADRTRAPQRILDEVSAAIDSRVLAFDQPEATRTMLCRYRMIQASTQWGVLDRTADRCGTPHLMSIEQVGWDQPVGIPAPPNAHSMVFVRITGVQVHGLESLESLAFKPQQRSVTLGPTTYRLVAATADDGLILRSGAGIDYAPPFNLIPQAQTMSVGKEGQAATTGKTITYRFYSESYRPSS